MFLMISSIRDLPADGKVIQKLNGPAPVGNPRILPDNRTCLFVDSIFGVAPLVSLDLQTGQSKLFQRAAGVIVHPDDVSKDSKDLTRGEFIDVSLDGRVVLIRHHGPNRDLPPAYITDKLLEIRKGTLIAPERREWLGLWDGATGQLLRLLDKPEGDFTLAAKFLPDGKSIAVSCQSYTEEPRIEKVTRTRQGTKWIQTVEILEPTEYRVDLYSVETGARSKELGKRETEGRCLAVSPDGVWVLTGGVYNHNTPKNKQHGTKEQLLLWNVLTGEQVRLLDSPWKPRFGIGSLALHTPSFDDAVFTPDGRQVMVNGHSWYDINKKQQIPDKKEIRGTVISPDGLCVVGTGERVPVILDITTGQRITNMDKLQAHRSVIRRVAFSRDGTVLLTISEDLKMVVWNLKHEKVGWPK